MQISALAERNELLDHGPQILRLRKGGHDLLMLDQRRRHIREHGTPVLGFAVELAMGVTVAHERLLRRQ